MYSVLEFNWLCVKQVSLCREINFEVLMKLSIYAGSCPGLAVLNNQSRT